MFFFDSYAIIELFEGNREYAKYSGEPLVTTSLNLGEAYFHFLKVSRGDEFLRWISSGQVRLLQVGADDAYSAMRFKHQHIKGNYSYIDCIGYTLALSNGMLFLTGDKEFRTPGQRGVRKIAAG